MDGYAEGLADPAPPFTAFRRGTDRYGFTRMIIHNATHVYLEEYDVEQVR